MSVGAWEIGDIARPYPAGFPADRLVRNASLDAQGYSGGIYDFDVDLFRVNRQLYSEAKAVWKRENVFVKISTPWPSAGMYRIYLMATEENDGECNVL